MKYESNVLKRLIDTYGVIGNPKYMSEIIKQFIVQGKECFPHLFTYQADWLAHIDEFGLTSDYVVSYTGQQIYAPHTKERPVKRAILKGSTKYRDIDTGEILETFEDGRNLELVSVKMPVLTTTGKNLFDGTWEDGYTLNANGEKISTSGNRSISSFIEVNESFSVYSSPIVVFRCYDEHKNDLNGNSNSTPTSGLLSFKPNTKYIRVVVNTTNIDNKNNFMIVTSKEHLNTYEPYKSNILTVNEPIELRGIGDVKDELNLLTGEVVERIGEIVLNEDITGYQDTNHSVNGYSAFRVTSITNIPNGLRNVICDKVKYYPNINLNWTKQEEFFTTNGNLLFVKILSTKASNFEELRTFLSSSPITIQYELAESIKTVDLTIHDKDQQKVERLTSFEGGTHFSTSSQEGSLLPTLSVDVVTDLEETLNLCSLDGNTL